MSQQVRPLTNFSFQLLVAQESSTPSSSLLGKPRNYSFKFHVPLSSSYLTRVATFKLFKQLSMHRSDCPWFGVIENILYLDIKGGLPPQGVRAGDICSLELLDNSTGSINVTILVTESLDGCSSVLDVQKPALACSEYSLKEECESFCGPATARCKWKPENKEAGQTYSTCTVDTESCPDHKCDALERLSPQICPQDCQAAERFRGFNILIDEKNKRPVARMSGVIVSCHGKCSAIMKSQAHSMKDPNENEVYGSFECGIACSITILFFTLGFIILVLVICFHFERKWKLIPHYGKNIKHTNDSNGEFELIRETKETEKYEISEEFFDKKWEFPRCNLILEETIGEGEFGKVVAAKALNMNNKECTQVAVKMLKEFHTRDQLYDLLSEYAILKEVDHQNVIKLLGACTKSDGALLIIIEFAKYGSLRYYLRSQRKLYNEFNPPRTSLTSKDILDFSLQIAKGMDYLVGLKFVHRDLAARNILLTEGYECKISDFGLTRDIYTYEAYWKKSNGKIPVKWLSPESLFDNKYTSKSDVWSFGVLLWELVTFGGCPYPGVTPERLLTLLKSGYRMEKPRACSQELYQVMLDCWSHNPDSRPTFKNLIIRLETIVQDSAKYLDISQSLVNNKTYLEPISSSTLFAEDPDDKSKYSSEALLSKNPKDTSYYDPESGFTHSPPSIKYSQIIHKQSEENLSSILA